MSKTPEQATSDYVLAQEKYNEGLRQSEIDRATKIDEATKRGEELDLPHVDPVATYSQNITK